MTWYMYILFTPLRYLICLVLFHVTLFCNMRKNKKKAAIFWHDRFSDQGKNKPINEILHYNVSLGHTLVVSQLHITLNYTKICAIHIKHNSGTITVLGLWFWIIENQDGSAHDCMSRKSSIWDHRHMYDETYLFKLWLSDDPVWFWIYCVALLKVLI